MSDQETIMSVGIVLLLIASAFVGMVLFIDGYERPSMPTFRDSEQAFVAHPAFLRGATFPQALPRRAPGAALRRNPPLGLLAPHPAPLLTVNGSAATLTLRQQLVEIMTEVELRVQRAPELIDGWVSRTRRAPRDERRPSGPMDFDTAERQAIRRMPARASRGAHRDGTPARELIAHLNRERQAA